ncbi:MAG TPA: EAL domain-containing protein [Burkholderiaceae bacterium]|jgi:EAL and modified HD-GYP domain-containing signal transduction protein
MSEKTPLPLRVREFFLARQPILDRNQELVAYELLFRSGELGPANITSDLSATASVISHTAQLGIEKVIGDVLGFINVDAAVLMSDIFHFLPREHVVLEIVETVEATPEILSRVEELSQQGFRFALDDVITDSEDVQKFLPLIDIVKFDLRDMPLSALLKLTPQFKLAGKKLLAEKVESFGQFKICLDLGFDYFQGYYFAKPSVLSGKKLSPSQMSVMELMNLVMSDADTAEIEKAIKLDVALGLNLLRLANTPAFGIRHRIDSLSQALLVLGREQLRRWLQIMLYAEPCKKGHAMPPLLALATTRGKMLELLSQKIHPNNRNKADTAFTVGIMSLMDSLFGMTMQAILEQITVIDEVGQALLARKGFYGDLLKLAEYLERIEEAQPLIVPLLKKLNLSHDDLYELEIASFEWSDQVAQNAV